MADGGGMLTMTRMRWQGVYLFITLSGENLTRYEVCLTDKSGKRVFPLDEWDTQTGLLTVNITNLGGGRMADNGVWFFRYRVRDSHDAWKDLPITREVGYSLAGLDKVYRYGGIAYAYAVTFAIEGEGEALHCSMTCTYLVKNDTSRRRVFRAESSRWGSRMQRQLIYGLECGINGIYQIMSRLTPKKGTRVLLLSESRVPMNGNLKALDERIKARRLDKSTLKLSYWFHKTLEGSRFKILLLWLRLAFLAARQDIIFVDDYCPFFNSVTLHPQTTLVQVWHAGVGFKSVGYARFGTDGSPKPERCCYRQQDYAIVGGEALREVYAEVFGMDKKQCLPYGLMRLDGYLDPAKQAVFRETFYREHPELSGKKLILFAPTFRGASQRTSYYPYDKLDFAKIYEMCGDEYRFLIKQHPFISHKVPIGERYADRIFDFTSFPDINDLFYVTDILITDYSSNIYEFSLLERPMLFFVFDKEEYELTRGVHRTVDQYAPGKLCRTCGELIAAIETGDFEQEKARRFVAENFDHSEGLAADRVIDNLILKKPMGGQ
ncbi:MAG: CDP-glycerol glycerophosphotransferase family protein [Clostridia bacterium]|nr:CDP-glycerol glycerophosphotransferase family protein [Clostridia bacterium]